MLLRITAILAIIISLPTLIHAQIEKPVTWKFDIEKIEGNIYDLVFQADVDKGWTVYSQHTSDEGPVPTEIVFENESSVQMLGESKEFGHRKEGIDKIFEVNVIKYLADEPFIIKQRVKVLDAKDPVTGYLTYMACDHEKCLPPTDVDFRFDFNPKAISSVSSTHDDKEKVGGGILNPVTWAWAKNKTADNKYNLNFTAAIEEGWTVYSQFTSADGPVPTSINFENKEGITLEGAATEAGHKKEGPDPYFDNVNVIKYLDDEDFTITQAITVTDKSKPITGYLEYMACDATKCLPPKTVDFDFNLGAAPATNTGAVTKVKVGDKVDQSRPGLTASLSEPLSDCGKSDSEEDQTNLWWLFIAGMLGGFAALMTPCVFPMIPITVSFFTKDTKRKGWVNGAIYGASIIVIYVALGLLITAIFGAAALNELSVNWIANVAFFLIFLAFAFSFFGYYELTLPSSWTTKTDSMADKGGLLGIFFMAATLSLVSFSCTGPIVGSALVAAANGGYVGPAVVMFGFSLALALPFGLFAAFPAWLNSLPRSGGWMNSVKVVLGFLEVAFAFKFLSTADLTKHWGILPYEIFMGIMIIVAFAIALYLFGFIKFPHDSKNAKIGTARKVIGAAFAILGIYLCTGFTINKDTGIYNSLGLTSGFSPPVNYNIFLTKAEANKDLKEQYPSFTKCANNIDCFKDYFEGMSYAKSVDKPVFLDFTGHACQNCRKVEDNYWVQPSIRKILNDEVVLVSLYVDDKTKLDTMMISVNNDTKLRNIGNQWADFQEVNFKRNSQPLYSLVNTSEQIVSHPQGFDYFNLRSGAETYEEYLRCAIDSWKSSK